MRRTRFITGLSLFVSLAAAGCTEDLVEPEHDNRKPIVADVPPPAINGGTLVVAGNGMVLAADADRDRVSVVSLSPAKVRHDLRFNPGAEPGRVIEGSPGIGHVLLRGAGEVASFDIDSGEILSQRFVCVDPRGIEYAPSHDRLFVACADGTLASMPQDAEDGEIERAMLEPDLRDVVLDGDQLLVSRMRSAEVLEVPLESIFVVRRRQPSDDGTAQPTVAWRMRRLGPDVVGVLHQYAETTAIPTSTPPQKEGEPEQPPAYGGGGGFCQPSIVRPAITSLFGEGHVTAPMAVPGPAVDLAKSPIDEAIAVALAGAPEGEGNVVVTTRFDECGPGRITAPGQPIAVAYTADGRLIVQSREPGELYVYSPALEHELTVVLSGTSRFDTGHDLFHRATAANVACASCHPSGADDGHVWNFEGLGPRRSQNLSVGLADSAPFHWDGDMDDIQTLANEVYTHRMGGPLQSDERAAAFQGWLFSLEAPDADSMTADVTLAEQGEQVFTELGCDACHRGPRMGTNATVDIRGQRLQVPSLRRVALRPPYMHDGRAKDLRGAIVDMIDATNPNADVTSSELTALEAYLSTR